MKSPKRGDRRFSRARHHLVEIERILYDRRGTDDCDLYLHHAVAEAAACLRLRQIERGEKPNTRTVQSGLEVWCDRYAPALAGTAGAVAQAVVQERRGLSKADPLGKLLRLSDADRTRLVIRTVGAYDVDREARAKRRLAKKRERDRERARAKRVAKGAVPREQYLAGALSRAKPWEAMGISRRTFERRRSIAQQML
jgi:hypothetical protein